MKLYTLDNKFIKKVNNIPDNFTGIIEYHFGSNDGSKAWLANGKQHRIGGPAIEYIDGHKEWYIGGKQHREDGPAIEFWDGQKTWIINDVLLPDSTTTESFKLFVDLMKLKGLL